ncbi:MAG TPA: hypothetical protein DCW42_01635 [Bacteroidetes bacterium]|nr:hypothetical protein [Bacteroidota bacterium]
MSGKCADCEFCFPHDEFGFVCADDNYGENISNSLNEIKDCYSEGFDAFVERSERQSISFIPGTRLSQVKIDGRKQISLIDQEEKTIRIKASIAKKMMPDIEVERMLFEDTFVIKGTFNFESFK